MLKSKKCFCLCLIILLTACMPTDAALVSPQVVATNATRPATTNSSSPSQTAEVPYPIDEPYPAPIPTRPPQPTETPFLTPTPPPLPTPLPTPQVTVIPTAVPPIIPDAQTADSFSILYREDNLIKQLDGESKEAEVILDTFATTSLYLANRSHGIGWYEWGSLSPDSKKLALVLSTVPELHLPSQDTPSFSIYIFDLDTRELTFLVEDAIEPVWSPDGTKIAYRRQIPEQDGGISSGLWLFDLVAATTHEIYSVEQNAGRYVTQYSWSPDSRAIVTLDIIAQSSVKLVVVPISNATPPTTIIPETTEDLFSPQWSPDGSQIAFVTTQSKQPTSQKIANIWVTTPDGSQIRQLTQNIFVTGGQPTWSSDGQWLAFAGAALFDSNEPTTEIWLVKADGSHIKRLTAESNNKLNVLMPIWSPNNSIIVFSKEQTELWAYQLATGDQRQIGLATLGFIIKAKEVK